MASLHTSATAGAQDLRERLKIICSVDYLHSIPNSRDPRYTNHEIAEVSILLETLNLRSWSTYPRLYITLRRAGLLQLRDTFLSNRHTDTHFPYTTFTLPQGMALSDRAAFLQAQSCVLAGTDHVSKWDLGEHVRFASKDQVPFEKEAILGSGGSGQVEVVVLRPHTNIAQAAFRTRLVRKIIERRVFGRSQQGLEVFKNELQVLKQVRHIHLVEIIGSYTDPTFAALIMSPVADCDLTEFLRIATTDTRKQSTMRTFFGCLAAALAYLHSRHIRHKDIKPSNILVHGSNVLITDFGLSRDCNDTRSTTEGPTGRTEKYCAPEVADYAPRNNSADVWSLGCVYLEMLTVLKGFRLNQLAAFMLETGASLRSYHANMVAVTLWLEKLHGTFVYESDNDLIPWIQAMVAEHRDSRPTAEIVASEVARSRSASGRIGEFCGICCRGEDEQYIDANMEDDDTLFIPESPLFEFDSEDVKIIRSTEETPLPTFASTARGLTPPPPPRSGSTMGMTQIDIRTEPTSLMTPESETTHELVRAARVLTQPRFFILRSNSALDIETSCSFGAWTCGEANNKRLTKAYRETHAPVYLIFSVVESRKFCGVAQMTSPVDWNYTLPHWQDVGWNGNFDLEWKSYVEVGYDEVAHLRMKEGNEGNLIARVMSGMETCHSSGVEMMQRFQVDGF